MLYNKKMQFTNIKCEFNNVLMVKINNNYKYM